MQNLRTTLVIALALVSSVGAVALADDPTYASRLRDAQSLFASGDNVPAARYAFAAGALAKGDAGRQAEAYSWVTAALMRAGLENSASYFFVRTLQIGDKSNRTAVRRVLLYTQQLFNTIGPDLLRKYLIRHTKYEDYDYSNRNAYLFALAKDAILIDQPERAIGYLNGIQPGSPSWPWALQLRGTSNALLGRGEEALRDFKDCSSRTSDAVVPQSSSARAKLNRNESEDLDARCRADLARTYYQMEKFPEAERAYDTIPKSSRVWPEILFEQAWNAYSKAEYNRALGKLVSYKSPALEFLYNSEVDVLNAQTYLALCLYADTNKVVNDFNARYQKVGEDVKRFVESNANNLYAFYDFGKRVMANNRYVPDDMYRMSNRFVRGPYFQRLMLSEREAVNEIGRIGNGSDSAGRAFGAFLQEVLKWRLKTIRMLGGAFVKSSLMDYHSTLIADYEKMSFIKLEMLKRAKDKLIYKRATAGDRSRGNVVPERRNDQFYWSFNGEFWNDELGDYVFGLESECTGQPE